MIDAAQEICAKRFDEVKAADAGRLKQLKDAGINVIELTPEQVQAFADVARKEVWPKISDEIGPGDPEATSGRDGRDVTLLLAAGESVIRTLPGFSEDGECASWSCHDPKRKIAEGVWRSMTSRLS